MIATFIAVAIALALWALLGVIFADDLRELDTLEDFADERAALGRASRSAAPPAGSPTRGGRGHP